MNFLKRIYVSLTIVILMTNGLMAQVLKVDPAIPKYEKVRGISGNANSIGSDQTIPYSTVTALDLEREPFRENLRLVSGEPVPELGGDEILLVRFQARFKGR